MISNVVVFSSAVDIGETQLNRKNKIIIHLLIKYHRYKYTNKINSSAYIISYTSICR